MRTPVVRLVLVCLCKMALLLSFPITADADQVFEPNFLGEWVVIAADPDLGALTTTNQQPVDFAIWQAADGMWQLWSCIRGTKEPGMTRLFHRWEGASLTEANWRPMGITMQGEPKHGERQGGLQAPYVFRDSEEFVMFYGGWDDICSAGSRDGKKFARGLNKDGKATLFGEGATANARDPMVLRIGDLWHCYYTAHGGQKGADYVRTSPDLKKWSPAKVVARGGEAGTGPYSAECPFVLELAPHNFYLFRTQRYGKEAISRLYYSRDPLDFGIDNDAGHLVCSVPVAAPEIIRQGEKWFMAALLPSLKGIQLREFNWEKGELAK
jgi:hypothetical protein